MVFLGVKIPADVAKELHYINLPESVIKEDSGKLHVTMFFFEGDLEFSELAKLIKTTLDVCQTTSSFSIKLDEISTFPEGDDGIPVICHVKDKEKLIKFQKGLGEKFDEEGVEFSKKYDYNPHCTLGYSKEKIEDSSLPSDIIFTVNEIILWVGWDGSEMEIKFPLRGGKEKKSKLSNNIEAIYKISELFEKVK